ncbi:hypothetical protein GALMADRAFT_872407 [Galerina marginata CBS 339.88]|uniref:Uncharacterized protein n=1 Tax=Galerina marginata (strain CBS 339.88) TaxID=685588 RepID=A0A067TVW0_GALM3|nr:hypothetical protein GALMADRAFT_872407 [Galerina marginata CBS 339.88]
MSPSQIAHPGNPPENLNAEASLLDKPKHVERPEIRGQRESLKSVPSNTEHPNSRESQPEEPYRNPGEQAELPQRAPSPKSIRSSTGPENPQEVLPDEQVSK